MGELKLVIKPDDEEAGAAEVFVDGTIGGRPYRFLLDTGAARSSVVSDDYTAAFDTVETNRSAGVFAPTDDALIVVPRIEVGPIVKDHFTLVRASTTNPHVSNLIGMDLLKDCCCHFLFDENRVVVDGTETGGSGAPFQALLLDAKFHPYVEVAFGPSVGSAVWDTGASLTVVDTGFIRAHRDFFREAGHSTGTDATGTAVETPMYVMAEATIGGVSFAPHRVAGVDLSAVNAHIEIPMDLILGYTTLSQANWLFDFPNRKWAITKRLSGQ